MIVGEDNCCLFVLRQIGHRVLVDTLTSVDIFVGTLFIYDGVTWIMKEIDGDNITASNQDYNISVINKKSLILINIYVSQ